MRDDYDGRLGPRTPANVNGKLQTARSTLFVQLEEDHFEVLNRNETLDGLAVKSLDFEALDDNTLDKYRPEVVVAPLFSEACDIVDVAEALSFAGYFGELWAVGPDLPNPTVIEREIREFAGHIVFRIVSDPRTKKSAAGH